jgi:CRISPR-associated protein Cas2
MMVLITYDVETASKSGQKRLRKVSRLCQSYGQRVQSSVFECLVDAALMRQLKHRLVVLIDQEKDSLRFYYLGNEWRTRVEHVGTKPSVDLEGALIE